MTIASVLKIVAGSQPADGLTIGQMRDRFTLIEKLEDADDNINLSQAELETMKQIYNQHRFGAMHPDLVRIADKLNVAS